MIKHILMGAFAISAALALDGCVVAARGQPVAYGNYGYSSYQSPNTVYYQGGYHQQQYYPAGYYAPHAPFVQATVMAQPTYQGGYAQPGYAQPAYAQPTTVYAPAAQPVYRPAYGGGMGVNVGGAVGVGGVSAGGGVRVGVPVP